MQVYVYIMTYSKIVSNEVFGQCQSDRVYLDGINDIDKCLQDRLVRKNKNKPDKVQQPNPILQDVFGDFICSLLSDMKHTWSPYGFMDTYTSDIVTDMFDIVKANVQVRDIEDDEGDDGVTTDFEQQH